MRIVKRIYIYVSLLVFGILVVVSFQEVNIFQDLLRSYDRFIHIYNTSNTNFKNVGSCVHSKTDPTFIICIYNTGQDIFISNSINSTGIWEPKMTKLFNDILNKNGNITVIDVGANIGYFSLLSAALGHNVVAIEPIDRNLKHFAKAVILNKLEDKVTILRNVVSNERRHVRLNLPSATNQGAARILTDNEILFNTNNVAASSIVLDDLVNFIPTKDVVIKIDIEGHECQSMENSDNIFDTFHVKYIITEWSKMTSEKYRYGVACGPENIRKMARMLTTRGFVPYDVPNDKQLDPKYSDKWRYNDVYWKHRTVLNSAEP